MRKHNVCRYAHYRYVVDLLLCVKCTPQVLSERCIIHKQRYADNVVTYVYIGYI